MKMVICPRCYNSNISLVSGNKTIPIEFVSEEDDEKKSTSKKRKKDSSTMKEKLIKLHQSEEILQCGACGASFKIKKKPK